MGIPPSGKQVRLESTAGGGAVLAEYDYDANGQRVVRLGNPGGPGTTTVALRHCMLLVNVCTSSSENALAVASLEKRTWIPGSLQRSKGAPALSHSH